MRVRLSYFDQNSEFESILPREGRLTRRVALADWGDDWFVLELDEPFEFETVEQAALLVRSRWDGHPIGYEPTSVFILLIPNSTKLEAEHLTSKDFQLVAWGMIQAIDAA